ncbi:hypothetical protein KPH14_011239 [Odynerus spinipes]|uniref:Uncharacterized protein n=1 Tax=Odynerus spinipes TaxID=1348599 RepID=A0AAD9R968_9HYME|nr:hypothetical protein KPH14_011239 [Odynerus spinipes]
MHRQVLFLVFYILLWFAFANDAQSLPTLQDQCLEFDIADLEGYVSTLNLTNVPTVDAMFAGFECSITTLPFGFLRSDWARLFLLRNVLPEDPIMAKKLERLFRILIIVYQRIERRLVPNRYADGTGDRFTMTTGGLVSNTTVIATGDAETFNGNRGDIKESEKNEDRNKQENFIERVTIEFSSNDDNDIASTTENRFPQGFTVTDFSSNESGSSSIPHVNELAGRTNITTKAKEDSTYKNQDETIVKEAENEKDSATSSYGPTSINFDVASVANSRSTVKSNPFETSTEKFNSIDSLSTIRTEVFEGTASQEVETERTASHTINFHDSDDGGNRNIEDDRDFAFTTLPAGSSMKTEASANGRTDLNRFDTDREEIKNDEKFKVSFFTGVDTVTMLAEKSEKFAINFVESTSAEASTAGAINFDSFNDTNVKLKNNKSSVKLGNVILSTSSEKSNSLDTTGSSWVSVNTDENVEANADLGFVASTKSSTKSGPTRSTVNDVTNHRDFKEATPNEVSISKKDNPGYTSNMARNSMDYLDPSRNSIYDVFAHERDFDFDFDIDESHRMIGNKLNKLPMFRKQPLGNIMNDHKVTVQNVKTTTPLMDSIEKVNGFKENVLGPRKRGYTNTNIENNFRFFYNLGGRPTQIIRKNEQDLLDFIRVKCKGENT